MCNLSHCKFQEKAESKKKKPSLWKCYLRCYWQMLLLGGVFRFLGDLCMFVGPMLLEDIVKFLQAEIDIKQNRASNFTLPEVINVCVMYALHYGLVCDSNPVAVGNHGCNCGFWRLYCSYQSKCVILILMICSTVTQLINFTIHIVTCQVLPMYAF